MSQASFATPLSETSARSGSSPALAGLNSEQRHRLTLALDRYLCAQEQGAPLVQQELLAEHPDLAPTLAVYFRSLEDLHDLAAGAGHALHDPHPLAQIDRPDTRRLGDFELLAEIGRGGMGVVYEARQISLDRRVAVKVLPFAAVLNSRQIARFRHEAQAAAQLHHPHIVPVFAIGIERGVHYYAMQLIDGQPLDRAIAELRARRRTSSPCAPSQQRSSLASTTHREHVRTVLRLGIEAAQALHAAHEFGIVHRDIKPSNLLLDQSGKLWVTDFGLARFQRDATLTRTGDLVGTLRYMSPEQAAGQSALVDQRTDVYSLGITLYELLCLRPAFAQHDPPALLRQIERHDPPRLTPICPEIKADLETVIFKAIAKERDQRYATAQQLADDLRCVLDGRATRARPPALADRAFCWARRHQRFAGLAAAALLLALAGLTAVTLLIAREKNRAEQNLARAERYFRDSREVLDRFGVTLSHRLADLPEAHAVSRELLQETRDYYERFIEEARANPTLRADLAITYAKLATLSDELGSAEQSLVAHQQAVRVFRELAAARAPQIPHDRNLAVALNNLALAQLRLGHVEDAERSFKEALRRQQRLRDNAPGDQLLTVELAKSLGNLGRLQAELSRAADARASFQSALNLLQRPSDHFPHDSSTLRALATAHNNLASTYLDSDPGQAAQLHERALTLLIQSAPQHTTDLASRRELALTLANLAAAHSRLRNFDQALAHQSAAIELQTELVSCAPTSGLYRRELAISENNAGLLHSRQGNSSAAEAAFRRALAIQESLAQQAPDDLALRGNLAGAYNNLAVVLEKAGQAAPAADYFSRAIAHQECVARAAPGVARHTRLLSAFHAGLDRVLQRLRPD